MMKTAMQCRVMILMLAAAFAAAAQKYDGPKPPKPDLPYLKHADNLVATEAVSAAQSDKKDETIYTIEGANSSARTPLAEPIFLLEADKLVPEHIQLVRLESKNGHRELTVSKKKPIHALRLNVTHITGKLYRLEADEELEPGEYSLSPSDSNQAFCFQVY